MGTRLLVSILLTMVLVASPALPVRAQPAGPSAPTADQAQPLPAPRDESVPDDRAEVNVARTYEALGNNAAAIKHYRKAAESNGPTVSDASDQAKAALVRLQTSQLP